MVFIRMVPVPLVTKCVTLYMYVLIRVMANPRYICSLPSHFILSLSPYPYPFPSLSITSSPISLSIHFHFPHFSSPLNLFPIFPTLAALPISPHSSLIPSHSPHNRVQSIYTDLIPFAIRFPTSTHTCPCTHVVRSRIHIFMLSYSLIMFRTALCFT